MLGKRNNLIKYLANKSIHTNKNRSILIVFTICLSVTLVITLILTGFAMKHSLVSEREKLPQASFNEVSERTVSKVKSDPRVYKGGVVFSLGSKKADNRLLNITYCDETFIKLNDMQGDVAKDISEVVVSRDFLESIGRETILGEKIPLDIGLGSKEYIVSGITNEKIEGESFNIYVSKEYIKKVSENKDTRYTCFIWIDNLKKMSEKQIKEEVFFIADDYKIKKDNIGFNTSYFASLNQKITLEKISIWVLPIAIILCAAVLVVYSIFTIFVGEKISEYGQLRTIGATKKQIKKIVKREGYILGSLGIFFGIVIGSIIGYILKPNGWNLGNTIVAIVISSIFGILVVSISIRKPSKIAGDVTLVESIKYSTYIQSKVSYKIFSNNKKISPKRLAILNIIRNYKRSILAFLSIGFCGILLMCAATFQSSFSAEGMARILRFPYGDLSLEFKGEGQRANRNDKPYGVAHDQSKNNTLNNKLKDKILEIDGVDGIKIWEGTTINFTVNNTRAFKEINPIWGFTEGDLEKLSSSIIEGKADYRELSEEDGVIVNNDGNLLKEVYGFEPKIGDKIEIYFLQEDGKYISKTFEIMAITTGYDGFDSFLRIPVKNLRELTKYNCAKKFEIKLNSSAAKSVKNELEDLVNKSSDSLRLNTFDEAVKELESGYKDGIILMFGIVIFIGGFGLINIINTRVTDFYSRKRQFAILRGIGMTKKQIRKVFLTEGFIYAGFSSILTLIVGIPLGYVITKASERLGVIVDYKFPLNATIIFIGSIIMVQFILSLLLIRDVEKQSLIDKIREL